MLVLITGGDGFVAQNLIHRLLSMPDVQVITYTRKNSLDDLYRIAPRADCIFHLAGVNRPPSPEQFMQGNLGLTDSLCAALKSVEQRECQQVIYTSSIQAALDNPYGRSKQAAEYALRQLSEKTGLKVKLYRLPNVFGRWSRPNYNSAVATFCHNAARGIPLQIHDPDAQLTLVHVDDVVESFVRAMRHESLPLDAQGFASVTPQYKTTVGQVAGWIRAFHAGQVVSAEDSNQDALVRALLDTYQSMLPSD